MKINISSHSFFSIKKITGIILILLIIPFAPAFSQISLGEELIIVDYSNPQTYEIGGITVSGIKYLDNNVMIMLSGLKIGNEITIPGDDISKAINKLWDQGLFSNIKISVIGRMEKAIFLNIDLAERSRLSKFSFHGIKRAAADNLREKLQLTRGDVVNNNLIVRSKNIIKNYYTDKGFLDTHVDIKQLVDTSTSNGVELIINIKKSNKIKIYNINIKGNKYLSTDKIKNSLKDTKEKGEVKPLVNIDKLIYQIIKSVMHLDLVGIYNDFENYVDDNIMFRIFKPSKYIENDYNEDKANIINKYNKLGYRDAKIVNDSIYRNEDGLINIDITVNEGNKYYFGDITWIGNTKYTAQELNSILRIRKGDTYNQELLETNLTFNPNGMDVSSLYLDDGYLFFSAQPVEIRVDNDTIDLEIRLREGDQATINKVLIRGNTRTNDHVVLRELRTRPGQLFSRSDIIRTTRELAQLKFFNAETITPNVNPDPASGTVDIDYSVEETSADQIELSGGWGYGRIIGTLGFSFNNFSARNIFKGKAWRPIPTGDGQKLTLRMQTYGKGYFSYSASFVEPWLGGKKPNALSLSYYHSLYSNGLDRDNPSRAAFVINGLSIGIGKRLQWPDDFFTFYQGINLQQYSLDNYSNILSVGDGTGTYNNISYNVTLSRNSISAPIYPRYGSELSLAVELSPPYSLFKNDDYSTMDEEEKFKWMEYYKWKFKAAWYLELYEKLVLSTRVQFGFLGCYNNNIGVIPFERFYLGGDGLSGYNNFDGREIIAMRGYANESITPMYYKDKNIGGTIYSKYTFELRYPLSLNPSATIYALTFLEAGNSWLSINTFDPFSVKRAAGVGVRVFLPMFGVLGLDYGYGFDEIPGLPDANKGQFHFSINQSLD
ncbi:MAG: BamA/TamA family outer membrane protein [Bacteroidales bacterium]|nr:BamA/TamA family outer membrane protein [Bacteroidales bacterium]